MSDRIAQLEQQVLEALPKGLFIGGEWIETSSTIPVENPAKGAPFAEIADGTGKALGLSGGLDEVLGRQLGAVDGSDDGGHGSTLSSPGARRRRGGTDGSAPDAGSGNRP